MKGHFPSKKTHSKTKNYENTLLTYILKYLIMSLRYLATENSSWERLQLLLIPGLLLQPLNISKPPTSNQQQKRCLSYHSTPLKPPLVQAPSASTYSIWARLVQC